MNFTFTQNKIRRLAGQFCSLKNPEDLGQLLKTELFKLQLLAGQPSYHTFTVPKADGTFRSIEDPDSGLKKYYLPLTDSCNVCITCTVPKPPMGLS